MKKAHIILVDDQIDVLSSLMQDLMIFRDKFTVDDCQSAQEAYELMEEIDARGERTALVISDHVMPNKSGIDFLSDFSEDDRFSGIRKVLITGQASHKDTIDAINNASIDNYISKPWGVENLHAVVKAMITHWVLDNGLNYGDYGDLVDAKILFKRLKSEGGTKG